MADTENTVPRLEKQLTGRIYRNIPGSRAEISLARRGDYGRIHRNRIVALGLAA